MKEGLPFKWVPKMHCGCVLIFILDIKSIKQLRKLNYLNGCGKKTHYGHAYMVQ